MSSLSLWTHSTSYRPLFLYLPLCKSAWYHYYFLAAKCHISAYRWEWFFSCFPVYFLLSMLPSTTPEPILFVPHPQLLSAQKILHVPAAFSLFIDLTALTTSSLRIIFSDPSFLATSILCLIFDVQQFFFSKYSFKFFLISLHPWVMFPFASYTSFSCFFLVL